MNTNEINYTSRVPVRGVYHKYLVLAADMSMYDGNQIGGYQHVMTSAESEEDALEFAASALEDGYIPVAGYSVEDLRDLANLLSGRALNPRQAYNMSMDMTDAEMAEENAKSDE